jgi:hypothetical protein
MAVGSIPKGYREYPHIASVLPPSTTPSSSARSWPVRKPRPELAVEPSPARAAEVIPWAVPSVRVRHRFRQRSGRILNSIVDGALDGLRAAEGHHPGRAVVARWPSDAGRHLVTLGLNTPGVRSPPQVGAYSVRTM